MNQFLKALVCLIYFCLLLHTAESLHCLSCTDTVSPLHCHLIRKCPAGDVCYVERFKTINGELLYNMGCYTERICHGRQIAARKRQLFHLTGSENPQCVHCCKSDACNSQGCRSTGFPNQRGPLCFNCKQSTNPELCRYVKVCESDQVCHLHEEEEFGEKFYVSSCLLQNECQEGVTITDAFGKRTVNQRSSMCCISDLCNIGLACAPGKYGRTCMYNCGHCKNRTCDSMSGACPNGCSAGWTGSNCSQPCATGTFGNKCSQNCGHCSGGVTCDFIHGTCTHGCSAGWTGIFCKEKCTSGKFGLRCGNHCGHCRNDVACDFINGTCPHGCSPGWTGALCSATCPHGTFGVACSKNCGHCKNGTTCDIADGSCPSGCSGNWIGRFCNTYAMDCLDILNFGNKATGIYMIHPWNNATYKEALCDMDTMGGGWTVFQKRFDGSVSFSRKWTEYQHGFGNASTEYWLGNDALHALTLNTSALYVKLQHKNGSHYFEYYSNLRISGAGDNYRLHLESNFNGTAGDKLTYSNNKTFKTPDHSPPIRCFRDFTEGGWWFDDCHEAYLNGVYGLRQWLNPWGTTTIITGADFRSSQMMTRRHG